MDALTTPAVTAGRLRRIAAMSLSEIGCRSRQEGSKWLDRLRADGGVGNADATLSRYAPALATADCALASLRDTFDRRFFAGVQAGMAERHEAADMAAVVREADVLITGRFDLLGYRDLSFGDPIDWHLDPVWSRRSPSRHWSQIDALDPGVVGDSKVVWELNRHQWMVRLAQATIFTGDERYGHYAVDCMLDWIAANPAGRGINWASSLEVSLRLMSWSWVLGLLRHSALLDGSALATILASIHAHASHVERYLSYYYSPNTHLTGEALGLVYAGALYPQFTGAEGWLETGAATLIAEADRQITDDGIYIEQSTCYQRYTCDIYLQFLLLAERCGIELPARVRDRVTSAVGFLEAVTGHDGSMPNVGDADGGWLMPLTRRDALDCRATLSVASVVIASVRGTPTPEALWLTGRQPSTAPDASTGTSAIFKGGGYAILRARQHELLVDIGPIGCFGHGHADLLSVQCRIFGEPCIVDAGTYGYTAEPGWRDYFRGTSAHSTITVDGRDQALPNGPFGWQTRPAAMLREWQSADGIDLVDAEHTAYPGVTHRRRVVATSAGLFAIVDDLLGDGYHGFELIFQFAPMQVDLVSGTVARATTPGGHQLWVTPCSTVPLTPAIVSGSTKPMRGWVSPAYGCKVPAPALIYCSSARLPVRIVTVLQPQESTCAA